VRPVALGTDHRAAALPWQSRPPARRPSLGQDGQIGAQPVGQGALDAAQPVARRLASSRRRTHGELVRRVGQRWRRGARSSRCRPSAEVPQRTGCRHRGGWARCRAIRHGVQVAGHSTRVGRSRWCRRAPIPSRSTPGAGPARAARVSIAFGQPGPSPDTLGTSTRARSARPGSAVRSSLIGAGAPADADSGGDGITAAPPTGGSCLTAGTAVD